ncbi:HD domain-containing protein [Taibaiella chishuiensis]|uniref:Putative metal-dependent HD superfamily phosphohydrolase n=1 Tax=Taibaiella chishuiensis TaxID=1434707 RepID=A0A2P8CX00_9BACT|nr:hypothetical protein [Taibaiella chishuiensis]PSK89457.1 putative metal-dependent HD superfamily phosphohydrolase [Taibaiella chishuiensis]
MLQETYASLLGRYTQDRELVSAGWQQLEAAYSAGGRHYHTLNHLSQLLADLGEVQHQFHDPDAVWFSLYYHDIVYEVRADDNEAQSAVQAGDMMQRIGVPAGRVAQCRQLILATAHHRATNDKDTDLFTDADLAILGRDEAAYDRYSLQVRSEYAVFPDALYLPGRKAVLARFLAMPRIFKTEHFSDRFETQARLNLRREHDRL